MKIYEIPKYKRVGWKYLLILYPTQPSFHLDSLTFISKHAEGKVHREEGEGEEGEGEEEEEGQGEGGGGGNLELPYQLSWRRRR